TFWTSMVLIGNISSWTSRDDLIRIASSWTSWAILIGNISSWTS
ncbi:18553_t:CDS:2, partial [Rhizophagus irregularis]